jgi:hypothetical protein
MALFPQAVRLIVVLALALGSRSARSEDRGGRLSKEVTALFRVALAQDHLSGGQRTNATRPYPCEFGASWAIDAVPQSLVEKYFHVDINSDAVAQYQQTAIQSVLDPDAKFSDAFCDSAAKRDDTEKRLRAFETSDDKTIAIRSVGVTFPIFDATFSTAIFIVSTSVGLHVHTPGGIGNKPGFMNVDALIYVKKGRIWRFFAIEQLGVT